MKRFHPFLAGILLCGSLPALAFAAEIRIACGVAPMENVFSRIQAGYERESGNRLVFVGDVTKNGADFSFKAALDGKADIGSAAFPWEDWKALMKEKKLADDATLREFVVRVIGKDILKVFAHAGLGLESLTFDQLRQVFAGEVKNWSEIGGKKRPVVLVLQKTYPATNAFFKSKALGKREFAGTAVWTQSVPEMVQKVLATPGAVGFVSDRIPTPGAVVLKTPEVIGRPVTAITKGKPSELILDFYEYIRKQD